MKVLHTSDWHLGHSLYGYDRRDEFKHFLSQLLEIIAEEKPDVLLVSGDIYDVSAPSTHVIELFNSFMLEVRKYIPDITVVVISGNHDSASRIDVYRNVWEKLDIHVIGKVERKDRVYNFSKNVIEIEGKGRIIAIPFINPSFLWSGDKDISGEKAFFNVLEQEIESSFPDDLPNVLMAHLTVRGKSVTADNSTLIGNVNSVTSDIFGNIYDYIALGHIHRPQTLDANDRIRYSGSPIPISFDEDYPHTVSILDIEKGQKPQLKEIVITPLRNLKTFPEKPVNFRSALKILTKYPSADTSYIRVNIEQPEDLPSDCEEQIASALKDKECRYCIIKYNKPGKENHKAEFEEMRTSDFKLLNPAEVASRFFKTIGIGEDDISELSGLISEIEEDLTAKESF